MKLHNTLGNTANILQPINDSTVKMYNCGLTVYSQPHIGNWVSYIYWDLLHRTLLASGYSVERVQNITDVGHLTDDGDAGEDKMQKGALREGKTAWDVAEKYIQIADHEAYELLGLLRPTHMPRATQYIDQQIDFVQQLENKGYIYVIDDGIYFDTTRFPNYGKMARLDIDGLEFGARVADTGKKNPTDFALWKFSPAGEVRDMEWDSPWGKGFPGWHLECSVMAREILGDQIDIHTGGIDHIPVHHTNEIAQTEAITDKPFSNFWVHANHIKVDGKKMSKSLGNIVTLADISERGYSLDAFKLLVLGKHYRTEGNFTWDILDAANNRLLRWRNVAARRWQAAEDAEASHIRDEIASHQKLILEKLQADLASPEALTVIEALFDEIERVPLGSVAPDDVEQLFTWVDQTLGLRLMVSTPNIPAEATDIINDRTNARTSKNWERSDELRLQLETNFGITILDTADGPIWQYC